MGNPGEYFFFATVNISGVVFAAAFLPETKGKAAGEIRWDEKMKENKLEAYV